MDGPRPVRPDEIDSLFKLLNTVFNRHEGHMREMFPLLFDASNWSNLFVMVDNGRVVTHVGIRPDTAVILGCNVKIAAVGCVATYDEYRGRGLATQCLEAAEAQAVSAGAAVTIISGSRGLYERFGATKVGRSLIYAVNRGPVAGGLSVRQAVEGDIPVLERLYEREPVRLHRPLEDWHAVFGPIKADYPSPFRDSVFIFGDADSQTGYAAVRKGSWSSRTYASVTEFAGDRRRLVAALPAVAALIDSDTMDLTVPDYDTELSKAAAEISTEHRTGSLLHHTVKIPSLPNFIRAVKPLIEERLGRPGAGGLAFQPSPGGYDVIIGEEHTTFSVPAFTTLAFGAPEGDKLDAGYFGGLLGALFPIPLPLPGLNYV